MADYLESLASRAFRIIPGAEYNAVRSEIDSAEAPVFYEIALGDGMPWEYLRDRVYPAFARFLNNRSIDPEEPKGTVVAVFYRERCFLLDGKKFLEVFKEMEGLNSASFHFRVQRWLIE